MTVSESTYKALAEMEVDSTHLNAEEYTVPDWDIDAIKHTFPRLGEGMILTNGEDIFQVQGKQKGDHSFSADDFSYFEGIMRLKALKPQLPVYEIHNHPTVESYEQLGIIYEDEHDRQNQRLASSVPSAGDIRSWNQKYNLVGAGIYAQDIDELRLWRHGDVRHKIGTKLALESDANGQLVNAYWAPEEEQLPNTEYIHPSEWSNEILSSIASRMTRNTFAYKG